MASGQALLTGAASGQAMLTGASSGFTSPPPTTTTTTMTPKAQTTAWFTTEIQHMMHGFGDSRCPLLESAVIIEDIVRQQMTNVLEKVEEIGKMRSSRSIGVEEFLFLLRKDKVKLRRVIRYIELREMKATVCKGLDEDDVDSADLKHPPKKRSRICYDFLTAIDQTGELMSVFNEETPDSVKHERLLRAELQTRAMDTDSYREFCESRQASFAQKFKTQKFRDWLLSGLTLDLKPNTLAIEVLSYLAFETVAQVVDLCLLVMRDARASVHDPFAAVLAPCCIDHHMLHVSQGVAPANTHGAALCSPVDSPIASSPANPTSPPHLQSPAMGAARQVAGGNAGQGGKNRNKRRRKLGGGQGHEHSQAIPPEVIREVTRRYFAPTGPFADFSKMPLPQFPLFSC